MATSYSEVTENEERATLGAKTRILAVYVYLCNLEVSSLRAHRYLYIAVKESDYFDSKESESQQ